MRIFQVGQPLTEAIFLNTTVVVSGSESMLIDCGIANMKMMFVDLIKEMELANTPIRKLALTHAHHDHIGCAPTVVRMSGCEVIAHPDSVAWIENIERNYLEFACSYPELHPDSQEKRDDLLGSMEGNVKVDRVVRDKDLIQVGHTQLEVIEVPGHIEAEIAFFHPETGNLILGDAIVGTHWSLIPGYYSPSVLTASLRRIEQLIRDCEVNHVYAAHFQPMSASEAITRIGYTRMMIADVDKAIRECLSADRNTVKSLEQLWRYVCNKMAKDLEFRSISVVHGHLKEMTLNNITSEVDGKWQFQ
jgi:glyoxylase-like metal-dependent hydrolase (beta-lactamase superfamily II)